MPQTLRDRFTFRCLLFNTIQQLSCISQTFTAAKAEWRWHLLKPFWLLMFYHSRSVKKLGKVIEFKRFKWGKFPHPFTQWLQQGKQSNKVLEHCRCVLNTGSQWHHTNLINSPFRESLSISVRWWVLILTIWLWNPGTKAKKQFSSSATVPFSSRSAPNQ